MKAKLISGIPEQTTGAYHDTESQKVFEESSLVAKNFVTLKERFFSINNWRDYCGQGSADFRLFNAKGEYVDRHPKEGDFIRIDIPGPGYFGTKGYDWVEIEKISDRYLNPGELENHLIICRPSKSPQVDDADHHIAHFYSREASSSFVISRGSDFIKVGIYGRNEKPNVSNNGFLNKIRSLLITFGGFVKLTKIEWKCVADGLLDF